MSASNYLENAILDHILGGGDFTRPTNVYIGLFTVSPGESGTSGTEVSTSGTGYARVDVVNDATEFPAASGGSKSNANVIPFPTATTSWGTVTHYGMFDASSGGNLLFYGALSASRNVPAGDAPRFLAGQLSFTAD